MTSEHGPVRHGAYVPLVDDPWPTLDDALATVTLIAEQARTIYGDRLHSVWLYGSRVRGDNLPDSDLDVLLVTTSKDADPRGRLSHRLRRLMNERFWDEDERAVLVSLYGAYLEQLEVWDTMFFRNVRADAVRVG